MTDESQTVTYEKVTVETGELTVTDNSVSTTNEDLRITHENQIILEDLGVTGDSLRSTGTRKDQATAYENLTTLEGFLFLTDGELNVTNKNSHMMEKSDYPPRDSLQHMYEEAIVDTCSYENQPSGFYQTLDTSTTDYLSVYSVPVRKGKGKDNPQTVETMTSPSLEGSPKTINDVAEKLCDSIQDNTDSHIYMSLEK